MIFRTILDDIKTEAEKHEITACDFPMEVDGVLNDQASYYIDSYK